MSDFTTRLAFECPKCGRGFATKQGLGQHSGAGCQGTRVMVRCAMCGREKMVSRSQARRSDHFFCGRECDAAWKRIHISGSGHPQWKGGPVEVVCAWCGAGKSVPRNQFQASERFFCGPKCQWEWRMARGSHPRFKGGLQERVCEQCGAGFEVSFYRARAGGRFCKIECYWAWMNRGLTLKREEWMANGGKPWQARVRKRTFCELCGVAVGRGGRRTWAAAHHIVPFEFEGVRGDPANGLLLCGVCHKAIHAGDKHLAEKQVGLIHWDECSDVQVMEGVLAEFVRAGFPY